MSTATTTTDDRVIEVIQALDDFYVIALTMRRGGGSINEVYFKADRYSPYAGRLQTEWNAEQGQRFKTEKGARAAIDRLLAKQTIGTHHAPRVVRYTVTRTERWETLA